MTKISKMDVLNKEISLYNKDNEDYISLTDIARYKNAEEPKDVVRNWMRAKSTIEFLGLWEKINTIGIISKSGRYDGGTYAHKDIAFEFASWISAEFKLYLIKEFQRLKNEESYKK